MLSLPYRQQAHRCLKTSARDATTKNKIEQIKSEAHLDDEVRLMSNVGDGDGDDDDDDAEDDGDGGDGENDDDDNDDDERRRHDNEMTMRPWYDYDLASVAD